MPRFHRKTLKQIKAIRRSFLKAKNKKETSEAKVEILKGKGKLKKAKKLESRYTLSAGLLKNFEKLTTALENAIQEDLNGENNERTENSHNNRNR